MKSGFVIQSVSRRGGGVFESVCRMGHALVKAGEALEVFGVTDADTSADAARWSPIRVETYPQNFGGGFGYSRRLGQAVVASDAAVMHTHGLWQYPSVATLAWHRRTRRPYVVHPHGMLDPWAARNSGWKKRMARALFEGAHLENAGCVRALCESEAISIRAFGVKRPICIVPNGIDLVQRTACPAPSWLPADGRRTLLYVGRFHPKKNLGALIEAWGRAMREVAGAGGWRMVLAGWGDGAYDRELAGRVAAAGLEKSVLLPGAVYGADKDGLFANADAFILPSLSEGVPMAVLEAWSWGLCVLKTKECNLPEGFTAGAAKEIGTSPDGILTGLREVMETGSPVMREWGARGEALVRRQFCWPKIAEQMQAINAWLVDGGAQPDCVWSRGD